jgi:transcriptional regulator with XRE-family HTH domain
MARGKINMQDYRRNFVARTRLAREEAGYSQAMIANLLDVDPNTYSKYEAVQGQASMLPNHLIEVFCMVTGVTERWLLTGKTEAGGRRRRA